MIFQRMLEVKTNYLWNNGLTITNFSTKTLNRVHSDTHSYVIKIIHVSIVINDFRIYSS